MTVERETLDGTLSDDNYHSLAEVFGFDGAQVVIREGFIQAQDNGATLRMVPRGGPAPGSSAKGLSLSTGDAAAMGPSSKIAGARLDEIWVRNSTAGSNVSVVFWGILEALDG